MEWEAELLQPRPDGLLTVYIPTGPPDDNRFGVQQRYELAVAEARQRLHGDREALAASARHVHEVVYAMARPPREGLVLIAGPAGLVRSISTPAPLPILGRFGARACLAPLLLAEAGEPTGLAVLVDDAQALLFGVRQHRALVSERLEDVVAGRHRQGGWSQARFQRHRDQQLREHFEHVGAEVARLVAAESLEWLVLGGQPEAREALARTLPARLRDRVAGHFTGQFHQTVEELEAVAYPLLVAANERRDLADLRRVADASAKGERGAEAARLRAVGGEAAAYLDELGGAAASLRYA
jgi:peptide subunit release factor 1 (eRF1)